MNPCMYSFTVSIATALTRLGRRPGILGRDEPRRTKNMGSYALATMRYAPGFTTPLSSFPVSWSCLLGHAVGVRATLIGIINDGLGPGESVSLVPPRLVTIS